MLKTLFLVIFSSLVACSLERPLRREQIDSIGHFEYRLAQPHMAGVVIAAPHGLANPDAVTLATEISERTGAGFAAAYGFKSKRISVTQPISRIHPQPLIPVDSAKRRSVFREFKRVLREASNGEIDLYIELRLRKGNDEFQGIEVASSGFSFEETKIIEQSYAAAVEHVAKAKAVAKLPLWVDRKEETSRDSWGMRHHGVLMVAEKGLSVRIPEKFLSRNGLGICGEIFSAWIREIAYLVHENPRVPRMRVNVMEFGRLDTIPPRARRAGMVIGAPHGSYDAYTAEMVRQLAFRTGWAAVVARGFTPTESGDGSRINVNRPTERRIWLSAWEFETERAGTIYAEFKKSVLSAAQGSLNLYIDIHQNDGSLIEVATIGLSKTQARLIKNVYRAARDRALSGRADIPAVELAIEPLDSIEVGAWAAKAHGILALARRSLHFELPANGVMSSARHREIYTEVLGQLIAILPAVLGSPGQNLLPIESRSNN